MDRRRTIGAGPVLAGCVVALLATAPPAERPTRPRPDAPRASTRGIQGSSTLDDQVDLSVTVYNTDLALVRDVREVRLSTGTAELRFMDIAASVHPATVHFRSLSEPARLGVIEQNYAYDLLEPDKLLRKYVGREVTLVRVKRSDGAWVEEEVKALLLAYNAGPVWKIGDEIVTGLHADYYRFPNLPENLHSRPTLIWLLGNRGASAHKVETSYLAGNLTWNADYVLAVGRDEQSADLDGWVTVTNTSGTTFRNAKLQLIAGELNRVAAKGEEMRVAFERAMATAPDAGAAFARETFSEYHLYNLGRRTTLNHNETKQVSLLGAAGLPVRKRYVVDGQSFYYRNYQRPGAPLKDPVQVYYRFRNDEPSGLGAPLPGGVVRVYQADSTGALQFAGEDRIGHTPKDEEISLRIGHAFDVVCERKQTEFQKSGESMYDLGFEVRLRNHKTVPITVEVNEPIGGSWRMLSASHTWEKTSAWAARFTVPVPASGEAVLTYRARARW